MKNAAVLLVTVFAALAHAAPDTPWPDEAYRVEWIDAHTPEEVAPNIRLAIPVTLRNAGDHVWPASQVFISYHWFRQENALAVWDGERTALPRDLRAGSRVSVSTRVATPPGPGSYVLVMTLVHEHVTWFEHRGAATVVRSITVRQPTP